MKNTTKGFIVPFLLIIIALVLVGGGAYVYTQNQQMSRPAVGTPATQTPSTTQVQPPASNTTNNVTTDDLRQQKAEVMNIMQSSITFGIQCQGKSVFSGNAGDKVCDGPPASYNTWPQIKYCGSSPGDTKWIVTNGTSPNWSVELSCKEFTYCNGKANASCNGTGCVFSKNCDFNK